MISIDAFDTHETYIQKLVNKYGEIFLWLDNLVQENPKLIEGLFCYLNLCTSEKFNHNKNYSEEYTNKKQTALTMAIVILSNLNLNVKKFSHPLCVITEYIENLKSTCPAEDSFLEKYKENLKELKRNGEVVTR